MKRFLIQSLCFLLGLAGCQSVESLDTGLKRLEGQPYQIAFDLLGFPDRESQIDGHRVFTWETRDTGTSSWPERETSTVQVGDEIVTLETWTTRTKAYDYSCKIDVIVDKQGLVRITRSHGRYYICSDYAEKLQPREKPEASASGS